MTASRKKKEIMCPEPIATGTYCANTCYPILLPPSRCAVESERTPSQGCPGDFLISNSSASSPTMMTLLVHWHEANDYNITPNVKLDSLRRGREIYRTARFFSYQENLS